MLRTLLLTLPVIVAGTGAVHAAGGAGDVAAFATALPAGVAGQGHAPEIRVADGPITVEIGDRATLDMPPETQLLTEREISQGGMTGHNTVLQVPMTQDDAMTFIEDALIDAGQRPDVIRTDNLSSISINENGFRVGIAFEPVSDESTIVLVTVFTEE